MSGRYAAHLKLMQNGVECPLKIFKEDTIRKRFEYKNKSEFVKNLQQRVSLLAQSLS